MSRRGPTIEQRLAAHPDVVRRRSPMVLALGVLVSIVILVLWLWLLANAARLGAEWAELQGSAVTLNQRIGSRFGVLIGLVSLPVLALLPLALGWLLSARFHRRATGTRLRRSYHATFAGDVQQGEDFQRLLRTRDETRIGAMNPSTARGNLIVDGWAAVDDRVGYVGVFAFDAREDPHWELVEFAGPDFECYLRVFGQQSETNESEPEPLRASQHPTWHPTLIRDYRVTPERSRQARRARIGVVACSFSLLAIATTAWIAFPPGPGTRGTLSIATVILAALSLLLALRIAFVKRKADRFVASDGAMLELDAQGIMIAGDTSIPWHAVSGAWALDLGPDLRRRAARTVFGAPGRVMLKAGINTASLTIGITDAQAVHDPARRIHRFRALRSGLVPARIEVPFGSQFGTEELQDLVGVLRAALPAHVPARIATGTLDYAAAWAGTADDAETIRAREDEARPR